MHHTGVDEQKVAFLHGDDFPPGGDVIVVFDRHNDLYGGVPMIRVGLVIGIIMHFKPLYLLVDHGFLDAIQYFDHICGSFLLSKIAIYVSKIAI